MLILQFKSALNQAFTNFANVFVISGFQFNSQKAAVDIRAFVAPFMVDRDDISTQVGNNLGHFFQLPRLIDQLNIKGTGPAGG